MVMAQALTLAADVPRASEKQIDEMNRAGLASAVLSYFEWPASLDDDLDERDQREGSRWLPTSSIPCLTNTLSARDDARLAPYRSAVITRLGPALMLAARGQG